MKILLLAMALIWTGLSQAEMRLPPPEELVKKAREGRTALRDVILDIDGNISVMSEPEVFDSYFNILGDLEVIGEECKIDELFPKAIKVLGNHMVAQGIRWLDPTKDDTNRILWYLRWMDLDTISRFQADAEYKSGLLTEPEKIRTLVTNIDAVIPVLEKNFKDRQDVIRSFRQLNSDFAVKYLNLPNIKEEDVVFWVEKVRMPTSMSSYIELINTHVNKVTKSDTAPLHSELSHLLLVFKTITSDANRPPVWLTNFLADAVQNLIVQFMLYEEPFRDAEFPSILPILKNSQLRLLAQQVQSTERAPSPAYTEHYLGISRQLITALSKADLMRDADELNKWMGTKAAPLVANHQKLEGFYKLKDDRGHPWHFSFLQAREDLLFAALADNKGIVAKGFFNVTYDMKSDQFTASNRQPDLDGSANPTVKVNFSKDGEVVVEDLFMRDLASRKLTGKKEQDFPDFFKKRVPNATSADGTYEGTITLPQTPGMGDGEKQYKARLIVSEFSGYSMGRLTLNASSGPYDIELNTGTRGNDGVLYLTGARTTNGMAHANWMQLRALVTAQGLQGVLLVGGRRMPAKQFTLTRLNLTHLAKGR